MIKIAHGHQRALINVTAAEKLSMHSGEDTNIIGSKASGEKVDVKVEGNLNLQSLQDKETYDEKNSSSGFGISANIAHPAAGTSGNNTVGTPNYNGSVSKGNINSDYNSVTKQAEIHAGQGGFDIEVGKNTDLKGAVISSDATPDKNKLSTDTLTYSDIQNKADYSASSKGTGYDSKKYSKDDPNYKNQGLTPNISTTASGSANNTTKSAVANGTIEVRSNPNQDISGLSRDTSRALNALGKIFDKETVAEQQELADLFGKEAFKAVGDLGLKEGSAEKVALDNFVGGIMSKLGGSTFASGAASAGITQLVMNELKNIKDPAILQWASAIVGAAAAKLVGGNAQTGASVATSETKNNYLTHEQYAQYQAQLKDLKERLESGSITQEEYDADVKKIEDSWSKVDKEQDEKWWSEHQVRIDNIHTNPGTLSTENPGVNMDGTDAYLIPEIVVTGKKSPDILKTFVYDSKASVTENAHKLLSLGGFTPLSLVSEGTNAVIYLAEGDNESAAMSAFAAIPGMKVFVVAKGAIKLVPETEGAAKFVKMYTSEVKTSETAANVIKGSENAGGKIPWGSWADYEKVTVTMDGEAQVYAKVGDRLYSKHAVDRMQPSGNRYGSQITQAGGDYGRSVAPEYIEQVIRDAKPVVQENGNLSYISGSLQVITNKQGAVVTIITK